MDGVMISVDAVSIALVVWILTKLYSIEARLAKIEEIIRLKLGVSDEESDE